MAVFIVMITMEILCQVLLSEGQVYIGTGVYGRNESGLGDDVVMLGGLFAVAEDDECMEIIGPSFQRIEAMVLATQMINDDSSLLPGVTLGFEIRKTCTQTNRALEQSLHFVTGRDLSLPAMNQTILGISGVVGATVSRVSAQVARLLRLFQLPQISFASTADSLSDKSTFDYFLRTIPPDSRQARAMADIVEHFGWTYVIAMNTDDVYGNEGIKAFINELEKRNTTKRCITTSDKLVLSPDATEADYAEAVEELNREWVRNASVVVLFGQLETAHSVLRAVRDKRLIDPEFASRNLTWIGGDAWGERVPKDLRETAKGMLGVIPRSIPSVEFDRYFLSLHPLNYSTNPWFRAYWEEVFNCSLDDDPPVGMEKCELEKQSLSSIADYKQSGKVTFTIDAVYAYAHAIHQLQQTYCNGSSGLCQEIIDSRSGGTAVKGECLLQSLKNISFRGMSTDIIDFDEDGNLPGGSYYVKNLQKTSSGEFDFEVVGYWDETPADQNASLNIVREVQWSSGNSTDIPYSICSYPCGNGEYPRPIPDQVECCWACTPCSGDNVVSTGLECIVCEQGFAANSMKTHCIPIEPSYLTWSNGWSIFIIILTSLGIMATSAIAIIFIVYHKHKVVKASSRELTAVLLTGIMLCYLLPFFFIAKPSPWICAIRRFGVGFCFSLCYSALLVKTNRIHRIFNRPADSKQATPFISSASQIFITALLVAVQVVIAVIWLVAERPTVTFVYGTFTTELKCGESPYIGLSITLGYSFILLVVTTYFAIRTRNVPQNFNEAKFISFTMYTLCVLWLAFIPIYFTATSVLGTVFQTGSLILVIIFNALVTLCILFLPKIHCLFFVKASGSQFETTPLPSHTGLSLPRMSVPQAQTNASPAVLTISNVGKGEDETELNGVDIMGYADATTQTE